MAQPHTNEASSFAFDPDEAEIEAYNRDGAILLRGVLGASEIELLERGLEEAHSNPSNRFTRVQLSDGAGGTLVDQFPSLKSPALRAFLDRGKVAHLAARLMRTASAQLILDQIFYKEAGNVAPTPWHQDTPYLRVRGKAMARVWVSCDPSPRDLTVQVVRGSHLWNVVYDTRSDAQSNVETSAEGGELTYAGMGDDRLPPVPDIERLRDSFDILTWDVEPGDAIVFNGNVLHGASARDSYPHMRRAFATMWGGPDLLYHQPKGYSFPAVGEMSGSEVPMGARIGDHQDAFPRFWPKAD